MDTADALAREWSPAIETRAWTWETGIVLEEGIVGGVAGDGAGACALGVVVAPGALAHTGVILE